MHGRQPTVKDIVLELHPSVQPEPTIDLFCYEQLDSSEDEDEQPTEPAQQAMYRVVTECSKCSRAVRLVVECEHTDIRDLQRLLLGTLALVCPVCA
ncbi:E7 [Colobus guereza papillomavirus 1]|uniref:Protein E7 n=1 Tax=Colobus guereza papillomavirus 1 TaxID=2759889 RepID=F8QPQ2_9PAPI|nr:E7 [Colobus guereza papillomavirus 1]